MASTLYLSGDYLEKHPTWHVEDSAWKASKILAMIQRNHLTPASVCEIGCGAGAVLAELQKQMPPHCLFTGYEISPQAFDMCQRNANGRLNFYCSNEWNTASTGTDLMLALDVVEHIDDYLHFLRSMRKCGRYQIMHIPLDLSLLSLITGLPQRVRRSAGHLHYFTRSLVLAALEECGFQVLDVVYTRPGIERPNARLRGKIARWPRLCAAACNEHLAAMVLGGFSLLVLTEAKA